MVTTHWRSQPCAERSGSALAWCGRRAMLTLLQVEKRHPTLIEIFRVENGRFAEMWGISMNLAPGEHGERGDASIGGRCVFARKPRLRH
jgi:hypothetical protein